MAPDGLQRSEEQYTRAHVIFKYVIKYFIKLLTL